MSGARLIVASRYLQSGKKRAAVRRKNYTKYIATRETVEIRPQKKYDLRGNATAAQKDLLKELLLDFPETKGYHEYTDYEMHPSAENCSELINAVIERNADVIGSKKNLVGYMALRPGAEKRGAHGLFTDCDAPIVLNQVADEIAQHEGNVWSHIVSLRREDAVRLGYDNSESWRQLIKRHITDIAKAQKISLCNLKWYAAFHNTTHHPHIHLLVYSTDPKEGYLTTEGIERIKSALANDIFRDELQSIYQEQTLRRDELRKASAEEFQIIMEQIQFGSFDDPELAMLVKKLYAQLRSVKGKKVYGYLPKEIKQTVDDIFERLAKDERIAALYEKWCDLEKLKYKSYTMKEPALPPLYLNKVFQPVRNQIIRTVLEMGDIPLPAMMPPDDSDETIPDDGILHEDSALEFVLDTAEFGYHLSWSKGFKRARELFYKRDATDAEKQECLRLLQYEAEQGNALAMHDLGKLYASEYLGCSDEKLSADYYRRALNGFQSLEPSAGKLQPYLQYRLGKMYAYGLGTEQDDSAAFAWFAKAAEAGNPFAQYSLANCYNFGKGVQQNVNEAFRWYEKAAEKGIPYAAYALGQMYANGEAVPQDTLKANAYYEQALSAFRSMESAGDADENLLYKIGQMYRKGLGTEADPRKALGYFLQADALGNMKAQRIIGEALLSGIIIPQNVETGCSKLVECIEKGDAIAAYALAKFLLKDGEYQDAPQAIHLLRQAADEMHWASFLLGRVYLLGMGGIVHDREQAVFWLTRSAEDGNPYAQEWLDHMEEYEQQVLTDTVTGLFFRLAALIEERYTQEHKHIQVDSKLRRMIRKKKMELGIKEDGSYQQQS